MADEVGEPVFDVRRIGARREQIQLDHIAALHQMVVAQMRGQVNPVTSNCPYKLELNDVNPLLGVPFAMQFFPDLLELLQSVSPFTAGIILIEIS